MLKYIRNKKMLIAGFLAKTFEVVLELFLPIFMGILMREGLINNQYNLGYKMALLIFAFAFLGYISTVISHRIIAKVSQDFAKEVRKSLFYKIQDLSIEDLNTFSSSSLINRLNLDVSNLQSGLAMIMRIASRAPVLMIGSIISLFIVNAKIALVLVIGLPIAIIVLFGIIYVSMQVYKKYQKQNDKLLDVVKDNVEGVRMIRAFAKVDHEESRFKERNDSLTRIMSLLGKITALSSPFTTLALNVMLIFMIYFSAFEINSGLMTQEQLNQIITYSTQLSLSLIAVMNLILLYTKAQASAVRINEVLNKQESIHNLGNKILNNEAVKIEFKDVSFSYAANKLETLKHINLIINPGETIGIVGLTGSGKTTFVDLLLRLYDVKNGEILINDINIKDYDITSLRKAISYASQKASLLYGTVNENIKMGDDFSDNEVYQALKEADVNFIEMDEDGLNTTVLKQGVNYSGGQRQRLALARALIKDSALLILDDVFSALDYITDANIRKAIKNRKKKQTAIYISQRLSSLINVNKIIVIDKGTIIEVGTHKELLKTCELYQKIYETQTVEAIK